MIALLLITDGRADCLRATLRSLRERVGIYHFSTLIVVNDSLDPDFRHWLNSTLPTSAHVLHPTAGKRGFAGAVQAGWDRINDIPGVEYVFHLEDDFTFNESVDVHRLVGLLHRHPHLAQVVLKRQPWNDLERAAGGIIEQHPGDYTECRDAEAVWTEHRRFFSTNPSVYPARLTRLGWPQEPESEGKFTHRLLADPLLRFAFWGPPNAPPVVEHIGHERVGNGY